MYVVPQSLHSLLKELNFSVMIGMKLLGSSAHLWLGCLGRPRGLRDHDRLIISSLPRLFRHLPVIVSDLSLSVRLILALLLASTLSCSPPFLGCLLGCCPLSCYFRSLRRLSLSPCPIPEEFTLSVSGAFHICQRGDIRLGQNIFPLISYVRFLKIIVTIKLYSLCLGHKCHQNPRIKRKPHY